MLAVAEVVVCVAAQEILLVNDTGTPRRSEVLSIGNSTVDEKSHTTAEVNSPPSDPSDAQIVKQCLSGDQQAWGTLLEKYHGLICSIPLKYGATPDEAADIFQTVSVDLLSGLPKLREPAALRAWLIQVTSRKSLRWKRTRERRAEDELSRGESNLPDPEAAPSSLLEAAEEEQRLQEAIAKLPERFCRLVRMLFYDQPAPSYKEIADESAMPGQGSR